MPKSLHSSPMQLLPGFLPLEQAAAWSGVSKRTLKRWIASGLPKYQAGPGSKVLIRPGDIEAYLTRHQANPPNIDSMVDEVMNELVSPSTS